MAYQTFQQFNQSDLVGIVTYPAHVYPAFIPWILFMLWSIALLGTYFSTKRISTRGDFKASFATASFFVLIVAFLMTLVGGLINLTTLAVCLIAAIVSVIILFIGE